MRQVRHRFHTADQANAFICGVNWVNDSALEAIDVEVGTDEGKPVATALINDEDGGDEDAVWDHREHV